jgi:hypothetical protein
MTKLFYFFSKMSSCLNVKYGIDIWDKAIETYTKNNDHEGICADISKLSPEEFDKQYNDKGL